MCYRFTALRGHHLKGSPVSLHEFVLLPCPRVSLSLTVTENNLSTCEVSICPFLAWELRCRFRFVSSFPHTGQTHFLWCNPAVSKETLDFLLGVCVAAESSAAGDIGLCLVVWVLLPGSMMEDSVVLGSFVAVFTASVFVFLTAVLKCTSSEKSDSPKLSGTYVGSSSSCSLSFMASSASCTLSFRTVNCIDCMTFFAQLASK